MGRRHDELGRRMTRREAVLRFWIDEVGPAGWYVPSAELDATIRERFLPLWEEARSGGLDFWCGAPDGLLAFLIVTDQFPRNMFRNDPRAFATDRLALRAAHRACQLGWDRRVPEPQRQFFYLPLMHSENLMDQDRCVRLFLTRMPETGPDNLLHARAHRAVIREFGRFPYRNDALGRTTTEEEQDFLDKGGYAHAVETLKAAA